MLSDNITNGTASRIPLDLKSHILELIIFIVPFIMYFLLTTPLFKWLIDDAGISFVYARNLAHGYGLVPQPGSPPVEGYSNFLWVIAMVPFFLLNIFHPYIVPKILSLLLIVLAFYFVQRIILCFKDGGGLVSLGVLTCLALNASFIIWTCSGLENALYVTLITLLLYVQMKYISNGASRRSHSWQAALLATATALTRPDGIIYLAVFPLTVIILLLSMDRTHRRRMVHDLLTYMILAISLYGGYVLFRLLYFGDIYPNTYYAKGGPSLSTLISALTLQEPYLTKVRELTGSIFGGKLSFVLLVVIIILSVLALARKRSWKETVLLLLMTFLGGFIYLILPQDWMGEFRFATPFFPFFYILLGILVSFSIRGLFTNHRIRMIVGILILIAAVIMTVGVHRHRLAGFYRNPTVSFENVANLYGYEFNRYADSLGLDSASVLLPDIGATLYYSKLRIYDLARLTDRTIARTLGKNMPAFYDYIFDRCRPTFIHTHGNWTLISNLDADPRFRRDYISIREYQDRWIEQKVKRIMMSGDYVRRDAISGKDEQFRRLQNEKP